ncbi:MAG: hypothetical protein HY287_13310 [Planctomycetes bacterium]|nr:hypothetical protein [Planctomycetota bacterium]MBI3835301.1 hypothetical protein [Planctomycetota bacterium]
MTSKKGIVRQAYDAAALIALLNLALIVVGGGYLAATGSITSDGIRQAIGILRGQSVTQNPATAKNSATTSAQANAAAKAAPSTGGIDYSSETELEIARHEAERIKVELDQRVALSNAVLLKVRTEREEFQKERESASKQDTAKLDKKGDEGVEREVAIYDSLSPKIAMQHLLGISDVDEAAKILVALQPSKAKKIVEAAKRGQELNQMKAILQRVRDVAPARSSELEGGEAKPRG